MKYVGVNKVVKKIKFEGKVEEKYCFENKWLKDCPYSLKPVFYKQYVDDIFVLFSSLDQAEKFKKYFSSKHLNINFLLEKENNGRLSFLDINIFREK